MAKHRFKKYQPSPTERLGKLVSMSALAALFLFPPESRAGAGEAQVFTKYAIAIAGVPIGNARVDSRFDGNRFEISANGRTSGVSRLVSDGKGTLSSVGELRDGKVYATAFDMDTVDAEFVTKVRMSMTNGAIQNLVALPPLSKRADRIPVETEHRRNIIDPLAAFLVPLDDDGRIEPEKACDRTIQVFDGWQRFDVKLSYKSQRNARFGGRDGFSGPVVVCAARYTPIAGHRPTRPTTVYLQNNKSMELWLAAVPGLPVLVPVHIRIGTKIGPLTLSADVFSVTMGSTAAAKAQ